MLKINTTRSFQISEQEKDRSATIKACSLLAFERFDQRQRQRCGFSLNLMWSSVCCVLCFGLFGRGGARGFKKSDFLLAQINRKNHRGIIKKERL
jgi:hypothetical protein